MRIQLFTGFLLFCICFSAADKAFAQINIEGCGASLKGDTLLLENSVLQRTYLLKDGELTTYTVTDKNRRTTWTMDQLLPCWSIPGFTTKGTNPVLNVIAVGATRQMAAHLEARLTLSYGLLQLKRVFRIYPGSAAIACDYYLKGNVENWGQNAVSAQDIRNLESVAAAKAGEANAMIADRLPLPGRHWNIKAVEFFDVTDQNNTLTREYRSLAYRQEQRLRGNLLFMEAGGTGQGLFWLKEAPVSGVQLAYPGWDFSVKFGDAKLVGLGITAKDIADDEWSRCYSVVTGVFGNGEEGAALALRTYQEAIRPPAGIVENMIVQNTWGDRGQDKNINEPFILNEIELDAKLGITHIQLDDGWQGGKSANSAFSGGSFKDIWQKPGYWLPDSVKFPKGFSRIVAAARSKNIALTTWFNPSVDSSFKHWDLDAAVLVDQYKKYGIRQWKIDGVQIPDKKAEINFRKMLDTVIARTKGEGLFNLDVTAGRRFGYHYFYEYGNLFLENRYTDWSNYYPYFTLRNLWMLGKYLPPQRLQVEFLNKWRNADKYPKGDSLSPSFYSFDYLFAITMAGQPLAWMEMRNLPPEAYATASLISTYRKYWEAWHQGMIFPIGDEPSGKSWTGFQSFKPGSRGEGFVLVFREDNEHAVNPVKLMELPEGTYAFEKLAGNGTSFTTPVAKDKMISFTFSRKRSFAFYHYRKIQ